MNICLWAFPVNTSGKEPACQWKRHKQTDDSVPGLGRSPGGGHGNPLQYSCLENPLDREAWWATVHSIAKSWTWLKQWGSKHIYVYTLYLHTYYTYTCIFHGGGGLVAKLCPTFVIPWTVARKAPLSMGFSRQECWSGLSFPSPRDLPNPGIEPIFHRTQFRSTMPNESINWWDIWMEIVDISLIFQ